MKLNWFSPLPPAHSAIAAYATTALPELARHAEVTVWSEEEAPAPIISAATASGHGEDLAVRRFQPEAPPWEEINRADVSIFHIGNHARFHGHIWELCRRHPGVVVMHDARLQELAAAWARLRNDRAGYLRIMRRWHGVRGAAAAEEVWNGAIACDMLVEDFPLTGAFVDRALGVVVHSADARQLVESATGAPILHAALPYRAMRTAVATRDWRPPYRLILFGFLGGDRGLDAVLDALASLPERDRFVLDVYGELADSARWAERIRAAGLSRQVSLHGYVPESALAEALDRAHAAINVRNPSRGEASFSVLQAWDHGVPVIVSRIGWFAEIPAACAAFVRPEGVRDDLQRHLQSLLANPEAFRHLGMAGRARLLQHHAPGPYAQSLARFAARSAAQRDRATALHMAERAAAALRDAGGRQVDEWALQRIGAAIRDLVADRRSP